VANADPTVASSQEPTEPTPTKPGVEDHADLPDPVAEPEPDTTAPTVPAPADESSKDQTTASRADALALAKRSGKRVEITSEETEQTTTYANPDGTYTQLTHAGPIRVDNGAGSFDDINTTLVEASDGRIAAAVSASDVSLSGGDDTALAQVASADGKVALNWATNLPEPDVTGSTAAYQDVAADTSIKITSQPAGYEFDIVLDKRPSSPVSYRLPLSLPAGWSAREASGEVELLDADDTVQGRIGQTVTFDTSFDAEMGGAAHESTTATRLDSSGPSPVVVVTPSPEFLADPNTVYPVTIDPTVSLADVYDTVFDNTFPSNNYSSVTQLQAGHYQDDTTGHIGTKRSFINFDVSGIKNKNITSASLRLYVAHMWRCASSTTEIWNTSATVSASSNWTNQPSTPTHYANMTFQDLGDTCSGGQASTAAAVTTMVQTWADGAANTYALALKAPAPENDFNQWHRFFSTEAGGGREPMISVTYTDLPSTPQAASVVSGIQKCTVSWNPPSGGADATYKIERISGGTVQQTVTNAQSPYQFTPLTAGTSYTFKIYAHNASGYSSPATTGACIPGAAATTVPFAPTIGAVAENGPNVVKPGTSSATVLFTLNGNGNSTIDTCVVETLTSTGASFTPGIFTWVPGPACGASGSGPSSANADGLVYGATYQFRAAAHNGVGWSPWSGVSAALTIGLPGNISKAVTAVTAHPAGQVGFDRGEMVKYTVAVNNPSTVHVLALTSITDQLPAGIVPLAGSTPITVVDNGVTSSCATLLVACDVTNGKLTISGFNVPKAASSSAPRIVTFSFAAMVGNAADTLTPLSFGTDTAAQRACAIVSNTATLIDEYHTGDSVTGPSDFTLCNGELGTEPWWSYVKENVGYGSTAAVNVANGNLVVTGSDSTSVHAHGHLDLNVRRSYNSQDTTILTTPGSLGKGWQFNLGFSDALAGTGALGQNLVVPSVGTLANAVLNPTGIVLVDRDGTRHVFTPRAPYFALDVAKTTNPAQSTLIPKSLSLGTGYDTICVDGAYDAPPGVHLSMWRYIAVDTTATGSQDTCGTQYRASQKILGYVTLRPDRLRVEYDALGHPVALTDGAGAALRYSYETVYPFRLTRVTDMSASGTPQTCTTCRSMTISYSSSETDVVDSAGRTTKYKLTTDTLNGAYPAGITLLKTVVNQGDTLDDPGGVVRDRVDYLYQGEPDPAAPGSFVNCHGTAGQLCQITDERNNKTKFTYDADDANNAPTLGTGRVIKINNRRGFDTSLSYSSRDNDSASSTTVTMDGGTAGGAGSADADDTTSVDRQQVYSQIDSSGRVGKLIEGAAGVTDSTSRRTTTWLWDGVNSAGAATYCRSSGTLNASANDNNLCSVTRTGSDNAGSSTFATPDEKTLYTYDDAGMLQREEKVLDGSNSLITTHQYARQWMRFGGTNDASTETVGAGGTVSGATYASGAYVLWTLADRTKTVSPRGNLPGANPDDFATTFTVDNQTAGSTNLLGSGTICQGGAATGNTGLICKVSRNYGTKPANGSYPVTSTTSDYDKYGALLHRSTPSGTTTYSYYADTDNALSGGTRPAGGWLKSVTDASNHFVVFGYDAAGNVVRTWDRDATVQGPALSSYPGTASSAPKITGSSTIEVPHSDVQYATGTFSAALASLPGRYPVVTRDQLGHETRMNVDAQGDVLTRTDPLSNVTTMTYDGNNNILTTQTAANGPNAITSSTYTAFDELRSTTSPERNQYFADHPNVTRYVNSKTSYDEVGRVTRIDTLRQLDSASGDAPAGCDRLATASAYFPALAVVCSTQNLYDSVDNFVYSRDTAGQATKFKFDAAHRTTDTYTPPRIDGDVMPHTQVIFDADSNQTTVCRPRQFTSGFAGVCSDTVKGDVTHATYDPSGRLLTTTHYRTAAANSPDLTTTNAYDPDGNLLSVQDANQHTTTYAYDNLSRLVSSSAPVNGGGVTTQTISTLYSASGDTVASVVSGVANSNTSPNNNLQISGTYFDAAHRPIDSVQALQLTGSTTFTLGAAGQTDTNRTRISDAIVAASNTATGTTNTRTRTVYDDANRPVAVYPPRAFIASVPSPTASTFAGAPGGFSSDFMLRTDYDANNRVTARYSPRTNASTTDGTGASLAGNEASQCTGNGPTISGLPTYSTTPTPAKVCVTSVTYNANGQTDTVVSATSVTGRARVASFAYSPDNLLLSVTAPAASGDATSTARVLTARYTYDGPSRMLTSQNAIQIARQEADKNQPGFDINQYRTTTSYTPAGQVQSVEPPLDANGKSRKVTSFYDVDGNRTTVLKPYSGTSGGGDTTAYHYTADGLLDSATMPANGGSVTTSYTFDNVGNQTRITPPSATSGDVNNIKHRVTDLTYTDNNWLLTEKKPYLADGSKMRLTEYAYDPAGRRASSTMSMLTYDATDQLTSTVPGQPQTYTYAPNNRVLSQSGRSDATVSGRTTNLYDADGNVLCATTAATADIACNTANTASTATTFYLDGLVRSTVDTHPSGSTRTTQYTYDGNGAAVARKSTTSSGTATSLWTRNDLGLPVKMTDTALASNAATTWTYNNNGQATTQSDPNGNVRRWAYNETSDFALNDAALSSSPSVSTGDLADYAYTYDEQGRVKTRTHTGKLADGSTEPPTTFSYGYDNGGRLTNFSNGTNVTSYTWDSDGNRLTAGSKSFTYNADDSIVTSSKSSTDTHPLTHTYDVYGHLTNDTCANYDYDGLDRLASVTPVTGADSSCDTTSLTYRYDALDRQTSRSSTTNGTTRSTDLFYSGLTSTVLGETFSGGTGPDSIDYTLGTGGNPMAVTAAGTAAGTSYLVNDGNGSIGTVASSNGSVGCVLRYDPFGDPIDDNTTSRPTGASPCTSGSTVSDVLYKSGRRDSSTGTYQLGSRTYDPSRASFYQADSYRASSPRAGVSVGSDPLTANTYSYVNGDPINGTDPTGHKVVQEDNRCYNYCTDDEQRIFLKAMSMGINTFDKNGVPLPAHGAKGLAGRIGKTTVDQRCGDHCNWGEPGLISTDTLKVMGKGFANIPSGAANGASHLAQGVVNMPSTVVDGYVDMYRLAKNPSNMTTSDLSHTPKVHVPDVPAVFNDKISMSSYTTMDVTVQVAGSIAMAKIPLGPKAKLTTSETTTTKVTEIVEENSGGLGSKAKDLGESCLVKHSFAPGTLVRMADGSFKPIGKLRLGDRVLATDPATGRSSAQKVTWLHRNHDRDLARVSIRMGARTQVLETTQHHPFWVVSQHRFVDAAALQAGDRVTNGGVVERVSSFAGLAWMYDVTVDTVHTYYVQAAGQPILVHNNDPCTVTQNDLHAFGNKEAPRAPRPVDMEVGSDGMLVPQGPPTPTGASTFGDVGQAPLRGHYHVLPAGTKLPPGFAVLNDGVEVGGSSSATHATIYNTEPMSPESFIQQFLDLGWSWAGKK
jgi:RHS repeat-associated protein